MKKKSILFLLLMGLCLPWAANAQEQTLLNGNAADKGGRGTMRIYKKVSELTSGKNYLIVSSQTANSNAYALSQTSSSLTSSSVHINAGDQFCSTVYINSEGLEPTAVWKANSEWTFSHSKNGTNYNITTERSGFFTYSYSLTVNSSSSTSWTYSNNSLSFSGSTGWFSTGTFYITPSGSTFTLGTSSANVYLYEETDLTVFDITATVSPSGIGTVTGTGRYLQGASCTLTATSNNSEFAFTNWTTMNGTVVSTANPYTFTVRADQDLVANFESIVSCLAPTNLSVINESITAHTAALNWTENGEATQWQMVYSTDANFDPDGATPTLVSNNPYTITGLAQSTTYYAYVRAYCDATNQSAWSNQVTFSTIAGNQPPTNLTLGTPEAHSITLSWTGVATNTNHQNFEVYYSTTNIVPSDDIASGYEVVNANSCTLSDLTPETTYYAWVRDNCGTDGKSAWVAFNPFTTGIACFAPTNVTASNVTNNSAVISWTGEAESFNVRYREIYGIGEWTNTTCATNSIEITSLDDFTNYEVQVQGDCGSFDGLSQWSASASFQTIDNCTAPFSLNYTDATCIGATLSWEGVQESYNVRYHNVITPAVETEVSYNFNSDAQSWTTIDADEHGDAWSHQSSGGNSGGCMRARWNSSYDHQDYLVSPQITLGGTFSFYAKKGGSYNDTFRVYLSTSGNTNVSDFTIELTNGDVTPTTNYAQYTYDLSNYSGMGYVAIVYTALKDQYYLYIDDVNNSVHIPATYGPYTAKTNVTSPLEITGLMPTTNYEWQVQGVDCDGNGGTTDWSEAATFNTLAAYVKHIDPYTTDGGYYLIASPVGQINPSEVNGMLDNDYDLYYFDQTKDAEWINYKAGEGSSNAGFDLVPGKGYLYANSGNNGEGVDLVFARTAYTGSGNVTLALETGTEFEGMNLVGNPFADTAYIADGRDFYRLADGGAEVMTEAFTGAIEPMEGVFVYANNDEENMTFTTTNPSRKSSRLILNLTNGNDVVDRAMVRFGEGRMLPKFQLNQNSTKVYMTVEGKDYAVVYSDDMGEMPVGFKAETNGSYTFNFSNEEVNLSYLHLIDNMTGNDVDLLAGTLTGSATYTFEAKTTDYENRFKLVYATGNNDSDDTFAFFSNGSFVINNEGEATLQVIDINGRILKSESINGCANVNVNAAQGIYMLRLVNGDNVKVQKVVVR